MTYHLNELVKIWRRTDIEADSPEEAINIFLEDRVTYDCTDFIFETEEPLTLKENDGDSTIEITDKDEYVIYKNGNK